MRRLYPNDEIKLLPKDMLLMGMSNFMNEYEIVQIECAQKGFYFVELMKKEDTKEKNITKNLIRS